MFKLNLEGLKKLFNALSPLVFFVLGILVAKEMNTNNVTNLKLEQTKTVILPAVAVTPDGNGVITKVKISAMPGNGRVLLSINPFSEPDTQQSFYNAIKAAYNVTGVKKPYDWLIEVEAKNITLVGGPSAGLVIAIGASAILLNKTVRKDCAFTGEVTPDGRVLPVGAVYEKAMAVLKNGYKCFIIPKANEIIVYYTPKKECKTIPIPFGVFTKCTTYLERKTLNLTEYFKQFNLTIIPVSNLKEALKYALK